MNNVLLGIQLHSLLQIVEAWKWKKLLQAFYSVRSLQFIAEKLQNCFFFIFTALIKFLSTLSGCFKYDSLLNI